jgi:hypothetical protein
MYKLSEQFKEEGAVGGGIPASVQVALDNPKP